MEFDYFEDMALLRFLGDDPEDKFKLELAFEIEQDNCTDESTLSFVTDRGFMDFNLSSVIAPIGVVVLIV